MTERICEECGSLFLAEGDDWYQVSRMHDDRVGEGPHPFCSSACACEWLADQESMGPPARTLGKLA